MKCYTTLLGIACLLLLGCNHKNWDIDSDYVKLSAQLNNPAEIIHIGDTLKFKLTVPDTVVTSLNEKVAVNSMQRSFYAFHLNWVDTVTKTDKVIWDNAIVTDGGHLENPGAVYISTDSKPFRATLNLILKVKGLYYIQVNSQPGSLRINKSYDGGLIVNFDIADKHWTLLDSCYPGFSTKKASADAMGYGCYCFRIN